MAARVVYPKPRESIDWKNLGFSLFTKDMKMVRSTCAEDGAWGALSVEPYGALSLEPAATILSYGQGIFEGIKAFRTVTGRIVLFRPQKNAERMASGAEDLLMPVVPAGHFLEACRLVVRENADLVPPAGEGALYLRPLLFGSAGELGVKPSSEYTFAIYVQPVGKYFAGGARLQVCSYHQRAAPAGVGHVKYIGNYAQCFKAQRAAKAEGFSDVIYLDVAGEHIEEAAASNFFCVDADGVVHTPELGTILPGVTRDTVMQLVGRLQGEGLRLRVGRVTLRQALGAAEAFVTGTGAGITPVSHLAAGAVSTDYACPGPVAARLQGLLADIQMERTEDADSWLHDPWRPEGGAGADPVVRSAL